MSKEIKVSITGWILYDATYLMFPSGQLHIDKQYAQEERKRERLNNYKRFKIVHVCIRNIK